MMVDVDRFCRTLVREASDAVIYADAEGRITFWNKGAERIFGFAEAEAIGASLDIIIPERQRGRHWDGYAHSMATATTKYGADVLRVPARHKDPTRTLSIAFTVSMLLDEAGQACGIVAIVRDETARFAEMRELRRQLMELEAKVAT